MLGQHPRSAYSEPLPYPCSAQSIAVTDPWRPLPSSEDRSDIWLSWVINQSLHRLIDGVGGIPGPIDTLKMQEISKDPANRGRANGLY